MVFADNIGAGHLALTVKISHDGADGSDPDSIYVDAHTGQVLQPQTSAAPRLVSAAGFMTESFRIVVSTGTRPNSGTDANVFITLLGTRANSGERELSGPRSLFENGSLDTFSFSTGSTSGLGDIRRIRIRHDNSGNKPGWFLDYITVHEEFSDRLWYFPCQRWLARDEDDRSIDRTLDAR